MRRQAAFLISPLINSLDNVWFNYEEFDDIEALSRRFLIWTT